MESQQTPEASPIKKQGGKKGMHHGHEYREDCKCARCNSIRNKKLKGQVEQESENREAAIAKWKAEYAEGVVKNYLDNLPNDQILFTLSDEILTLFREKIVELKKQFPQTTYRAFIDSVLNTSLKSFLTQI